VILVVALWVLTAAPRAHAGVAVELGLTQLATRAGAVVVATPVESRSLWEQSGGRSRIVTYHRVVMEQVVAGKLEGTEAWVRCLGGQVGDIGQRVEGEAVLPRGKRMMLFLTGKPDGTWAVVGMAQGAWMVQRGPDGVDRVQPGLQRGMIVPNREKVSAQAELVGRSLHEAMGRVRSLRAQHGK
jgi:hypothetical protein